ncbi:MAG: hypothetical protein LHV68_03950 [Elusimicrobia bacterium]|nr:hypothetical protein [Candidatus Liberimonas magnetica]
MKIEEKIVKINKCFINFVSNPDKNIDSLINLCGELMNADYALYNVLEDDMLVTIGKWNVPDVSNPRSKAKGHICYDLIKNEKDKIFIVNNLSKTKYNLTDAGVKKLKLETYIGHKVEIGNKIIGTMCVLYCKSYEVNEDDKLIMGIIASAVGIEELHKRTLNEKDRFLKELIRKEKMAGIGTLAAGVAHEFNNMLQVINGYIERAKKAKTSKEVEEALSVITETSEEAVKIVRNLLVFSRQERINIELCNLTDLIDFVLVITGRFLKKNNISIIKKYESPSFTVSVNKDEMQQVFLNLIMNANDAMSPNGGDLIISVSKTDGFIEISFFDTGKGLDEESQKRVFEPFYSTKGSIGSGTVPGTGLGLFVSYGTVQNHGGSIEIKSKPGQGCEVIIRLPNENTGMSSPKKDI